MHNTTYPNTDAMLPFDTWSLSLDEVCARCPTLVDALVELDTICQNETAAWEAAGFIMSVDQLAGLGLEKLGSTALILSLPAVFESSLTALVSQTAFVQNTNSLDLMHCMTVASWYADNGDEINVPVDAIDAVVNGCVPYDDVNFTRPVTPVPVVMLAGDTVAIGGFYVDESWEGGLQGHGICADSNWNPYRIYDDATLAEAAVQAQKHGLFPWRGRLWCETDSGLHLWCETGSKLIGLPVMDFRPRQILERD